MAKMKFVADADEAGVVRRGLQRALDSIDKASAEAVETTVVADLKAAHLQICLAITFLTQPDQTFAPMRRETDPDYKDVRGRKTDDFLKNGGTGGSRKLFDRRRNQSV